MDRLGTWNVKGINRIGKSEEVVGVFRNVTCDLYIKTVRGCGLCLSDHSVVLYKVKLMEK